MRLRSAMAGAVFSAVLLTPDARAQRPTVTLAEALRLAEQTQPGMVQAEGQVRTSSANVRSAKGAYLPSFSLSGSGNESYSGAGSRVDPTTNQIVGSNWTRSAGGTLSASWDLFTGFRRRADVRAANASSQAAQAGLVDTRYQLRLTTTDQFFAALSSAQLVDVRIASVREAEEQLRAAIARLRAGTATRADTLTSRVNLGTAQLNLTTAQSDLAAAEAGLARLIGHTGRVAAADDSSFYHPSMVDTTTLRTEALARSPRVQSALASARAARAAVAAARAAYWPTLTFGAATGYSGTRGTGTGFSNNSQLSLRLSWNLFNGFSREAEIITQESSADLADATASDDGRAVDVGITTYLAQLEAASTNIAITQTSVAAGEENLRVVRERYQLGVATIVDLLTAQAALDQARVDSLNARFDYLRAKAQLEAIVGRQL